MVGCDPNNSYAHFASSSVAQMIVPYRTATVVALIKFCVKDPDSVLEHASSPVVDACCQIKILLLLALHYSRNIDRWNSFAAVAVGSPVLHQAFVS